MFTTPLYMQIYIHIHLESIYLLYTQISSRTFTFEAVHLLPVLSTAQSILQVTFKMGPIKLLAKGVTGAYGLAREAMADHQDKRPSGQPQLEVPSDAKDYDGSSDASSVSSSDGEEEAQELDEAQQKFAGGHKNQELQEAKDVDGVFKVLAKQHQQHPPPGYTEVAGKLDLPVILPQRRPKNKERGFVRAYAPVLQTCGIDQTEFLAFLDGFEKAIQVCQPFKLFCEAF